VQAAGVSQPAGAPSARMAAHSSSCCCWGSPRMASTAAALSPAPAHGFRPPLGVRARPSDCPLQARTMSQPKPTLLLFYAVCSDLTSGYRPD